MESEVMTDYIFFIGISDFGLYLKYIIDYQ